jgi:hypothetical protein
MHTEEMDFLFAAKTPWVWDAEKNFAGLRRNILRLPRAHSGKMMHDAETGSIGTNMGSEPSRDFKEENEMDGKHVD